MNLSHESMRAALQAELDKVSSGGSVPLNSSEYPGPFEVRKSLTIEGKGATLWALAGPLITIKSGTTVVLKNLKIEVTGDFQQDSDDQTEDHPTKDHHDCAILVEPGASLKLQDVEVYGSVIGLNEVGVWRYPKCLYLGQVLAGQEHSFVFRMVAAANCHLSSEINGLSVTPNKLPAGRHEVRITLEKLRHDVLLRGRVLIDTGRLKRWMVVQAHAVQTPLPSPVNPAMAWEPADWDLLVAPTTPSPAPSAATAPPVAAPPVAAPSAAVPQPPVPQPPVPQSAITPAQAPVVPARPPLVPSTTSVVPATMPVVPPRPPVVPAKPPVVPEQPPVVPPHPPQTPPSGSQPAASQPSAPTRKRVQGQQIGSAFTSPPKTPVMPKAPEPAAPAASASGPVQPIVPKFRPLGAAFSASVPPAPGVGPQPTIPNPTATNPTATNPTATNPTATNPTATNPVPLPPEQSPLGSSSGQAPVTPPIPGSTANQGETKGAQQADEVNNAPVAPKSFKMKPISRIFEPNKSKDDSTGN